MNYRLVKKIMVLIIITLFLGTSFTAFSTAIRTNQSFLTNKKINIDEIDPISFKYREMDIIGSIDEYGTINIQSEPAGDLDNDNHILNEYNKKRNNTKKGSQVCDPDIDKSTDMKYSRINIPTRTNRNGYYTPFERQTYDILDTGEGDIFYVGGTGPNNFTSIQNAIDSASSGDTVFVYDDSSPYLEQVIIDKSINLIGENTETTIIDGSELEDDLDTITVSSDNVLINGFSIVNNIGYYYEAAILITGDFVTVTECIFHDNEWIGIYLSGADNCRIQNCEMFQNLISIYLVNSDENEIKDSFFYDNAEDIILYDRAHYNKIINCSCFGNSYSGIHIQRSTGNYVENCTCQDGYEGIGLAYAPNTVLKNNNIINNIKNFGIGSSILEDFYCDIDTSNKIDDKPIYYWIDKHFEQVPADAAFIGLISCSNIVVEEFQLTNNFQGIVCAGSSNCTIDNNLFKENDGHGVFFVNTKDCSIKNCVFQDSFFSGVYLISGSDNNIVFNNTFPSIRVNGVWIQDSLSCNVNLNYIIDCVSAISLEKSGNSIIENNEMINCGLEVDGEKLDDYLNDADTSNTINGKKLYYLTDQDGITIPEDAGSVILINSSNCIISGLELSDTTIGIVLAFSSNNIISDNVINDIKIVAIDLDCQDNDYNTIENNLIKDNSYGIDIDLSDNVNILNNILENNGGSAVSFDGSDRNNIFDNQILDSFNGMYVYGSDFNKFKNNTVRECDFNAIYLLYSRLNELQNNIMYNCGLLIYGLNPSEYTQEVDTTNKVNDKTLYYYLNQNNIDIPSDAGEVILINCNSCMVTDLNLTGGTIGIELAYSYNNTIANNILNENKYAGIYLESSENNLIEKNTINKNTYGIDMQLANENSIWRNTIIQNAYGFDIYLSDSNIFASNIIKYNGYGMRFGVPCSDNSIHHNNFIDNNVNAQDENPDTNIWNDGRKGNYWSDYTSLYPDASKIWIRGIWNIPYDIPGEENQDVYPLILPSLISRVRSIDLLNFNLLKTNGFLFSFIRFIKMISAN